MKTIPGSTLGPVSATDQGFIKLLLDRAGLAKDAAKLVKFESAAAAVTAVERGAIDGTMGSPPNSLAAVARGKAAVVVNAREIPEYRDMAYDILSTTEKYAAQNKDAVRRVASAVARADNWIKVHPEAALAFEQKHFPSYSPEVLKASLELVTFAENGQQTAQQWQNAIKTYVDAGLIKSTDAAEGQVWTNKYIDLGALHD
jgi:ABC-type nitrate/sulfonate/bicarbonate transport system substrate-binding protein